MNPKQGPIRRLLSWCWADVRSGENLDLWLLFIAALLFTMLGAVGLSSTQVLSSVVLGLLALLAVSQIRSREAAHRILNVCNGRRTELFHSEFPDVYYEARKSATHSYSFAGLTMKRTLPTMEADIVRILSNGGAIKILLPDPDNDMLMRMVAASRRFREPPEGVAEAVRHSLDAAARIHDGSGRRPEVRTTSLLPRTGYNIIDADHPNALLMVQMYQVAPPAEPGPIFLIKPSDGQWFEHFNAEFKRLWDLGIDWTIAP